MLWTNKRPTLWCHFFHSQKRRETETWMGEWVAALTTTNNPKNSISFLFPQCWRRSLDTSGGNIFFHKGHTCSTEYEVETSCWPLHVPQNKVLTKMIKPYYEGERESKRGTQRFVVLPFPVIKLNEKWQKHRIGNTKVQTPRNEWPSRQTPTRERELGCRGKNF